MMQCFIRKNQLGLTLVETTVALGILMIGILASLVLMLSTFNFVQKSEQEIVVVNLAREGIEIVRSLRNSEAIDLFSGAYDNKSYIVDNENYFNLNREVISGDIDDCNLTNDCQLYSVDNIRYLHDGSGTITFFKRMITIIGVSNYEKKIISEVQWKTKGKTNNLILETDLTNWQEAVKLFNQ